MLMLERRVTMSQPPLSRLAKLKLFLKKKWIFGIPVLFFALFGFVIFAVASFQVVMTATNQNEFCFSCHIGMDTIVEEYQDSPHFQKNEHGEVKATCADCHVPHDLIPKIIVKTKASADIWYMITGKINMENFEDERPRMAQHVWDGMLEDDSKNCRTCHEMPWLLSEERPQRARLNHKRIESHGETCIDCHYGIAHKRPSKRYIKSD